MSKAAMQAVNFLDIESYVSGGGLPPGMHALFFDVQNFKPEAKPGQPVRANAEARLGVMVTAIDLNNVAEKPHTQFMAFGKGLNKCYAPNADTGKGIVPIPGAPVIPFPASSNWGYFLKSMYDCGLPKGIASNDLSVLDGMWVETAQIDEPEERKSFRATNKAMSEADEPEIKGSGKISVVLQFLEGGKPWEGGGGLPDGATLPVPAVKGNGSGKAPVAPPARTVPAVKAAAGKPAVKAAAGKAVAPKPVVAAAPEQDETELRDAAVQGVATVLGEAPDGLFKVKLRSGTFQAVTKAYSGEMAQSVLNTFFASDDALNGILGDVGYIVQGANIVPQPES